MAWWPIRYNTITSFRYGIPISHFKIYYQLTTNLLNDKNNRIKFKTMDAALLEGHVFFLKLWRLNLPIKIGKALPKRDTFLRL